MKWLKLIVFAVGSYYILKFIVRLYHARKKMQQQQNSVKNPVHPANKKSVINPQAGEYTDYEEIKD